MGLVCQDKTISEISDDKRAGKGLYDSTKRKYFLYFLDVTEDMNGTSQYSYLQCHIFYRP